MLSKMSEGALIFKDEFFSEDDDEVVTIYKWL